MDIDEIFEDIDKTKRLKKDGKKKDGKNQDGKKKDDKKIDGKKKDVKKKDGEKKDIKNKDIKNKDIKNKDIKNKDIKNKVYSEKNNNKLDKVNIVDGNTQSTTLDDSKYLNSKESRKFIDGLPIYSLEELGIGQGGDTEDCPFECDCCY